MSGFWPLTKDGIPGYQVHIDPPTFLVLVEIIGIKQNPIKDEFIDKWIDVFAFLCTLLCGLEEG